MKFKDNPNVFLGKDRKGKARTLSHLQSAFKFEDGLINTPQSLGINYLNAVADIYELKSSELKNLSSFFRPKSILPEGDKLKFIRKMSF